MLRYYLKLSLSVLDVVCIKKSSDFVSLSLRGKYEFL